MHITGLPAQLTEMELEEMLRLYHFRPEDKELLRELAGELCLRCRAEAFYVLPREEEAEVLLPQGEEAEVLLPQEEKAEEKPPQGEEAEELPPREEEAEVLLTLGAGVDAWLEETGRSGELLRFYGADCLASFLLQKAYESFDRLFRDRTGRWIRAYRFYGEQLPLEGLRGMFKRLPQEAVSLDDAYLLRPVKSVAFRALLSDTPVRREPLCTGCSGSCRNGCRISGSRSDGSETVGSRSDGSETVGSRISCSKTVGSRVDGSETAGSRM